MGNADPEGYHILPGMGGTGAALSLMGAFARLHGSEEHKIQVFSQAPCFFDYKDWPRVADEMRMEWNPDADPRSPLTLELLNSPANPSGEIRTARVGNTSLLICDFVYDWPYIAKGAVQTQVIDRPPARPPPRARAQEPPPHTIHTPLTPVHVPCLPLPGLLCHRRMASDWNEPGHKPSPSPSPCRPFVAAVRRHGLLNVQDDWPRGHAVRVGAGQGQTALRHGRRHHDRPDPRWAVLCCAAPCVRCVSVRARVRCDRMCVSACAHACVYARA